MKVVDIINASKTKRFSVEVLPPLKGKGFNALVESVKPVLPFNPAFINLTFHKQVSERMQDAQGRAYYIPTHPRPATIMAAARLKQETGVEVVPHLITGNFSKIQLEDFILDAHYGNLNNIFAIRGDISEYDEQVKHLNYPHSCHLVQQIYYLNAGIYQDFQATQDLDDSLDMSIGVAAYPQTHFAALSEDSDLDYLKAKQDLGAAYAITQMFFDNECYFRFLDRCEKAGITIPIIPGIKVITNLQQVSKLLSSKEIFGHRLPAQLLMKMEALKDKRQVGIDWATQQADELLSKGVDCVHFFGMTNTSTIAEVVKNLNLQDRKRVE